MCSISRCPSNFVKLLRSRGLVDKIFPETKFDQLASQLKSKQRVFYAGFDPTAESLHVGNLTVLMLALNAVRSGHKFVAVIGDATAQIGDPSGRLTERSVLLPEDIETNSFGISADISRIFANHTKYFCKGSESLMPEPTIIHNSTWYKGKGLIPFISQFGRELRMGDLLSRSSIKTRLESPEGLSFSEFSYQLFQAYDWYHLYQKYECMFQLGGSDQMGNITSGYFLIKKLLLDNGQVPSNEDREYLFGLLCPLLTDELGNKFGKSLGSPVWLSPLKMTPFDFYQFFMRVHDSQVGMLLKLFTFINDQEIDHIMNKFLENTSSRYAQERLAREITLLVHGGDGLASAERVTKALYHFDIRALADMSIEEVTSVFGNDLITTLPLPSMDGETPDSSNFTLLDLAMKASVFPNLSSAGQIIRAGGFYVNGEKVNDPSTVFDEQKHILKNDLTLIRVGKRRYFIVRWK